MSDLKGLARLTKKKELESRIATKTGGCFDRRGRSKSAKGAGGAKPGKGQNKLRMRRVREAQRAAKEAEKSSSPAG